MPFIDQIKQSKSLAIVGLAKNTGKTVCLNYILSRLHQEGIRMGVTSIGVDGEQKDAVFGTSKPEVTLYPHTLFITAETFYLQRHLLSRILTVDDNMTVLGRTVMAEVLVRGTAMLSGATTTAMLSQQIKNLLYMGSDIAIVDGALSRLSLASPSVTESMILCTGAAISPSITQIISQTKFVCDMLHLPTASPSLVPLLENIDKGIWFIDCHDGIHNSNIESAFLLNQQRHLLKDYQRLFVAGAITDNVLKVLLSEKKPMTLIARDFTRLFLTPMVYTDFLRHGHHIEVLQQPTLRAIVFNPFSPNGYRLPSKDCCQSLQEALQIPVYDVKNI